MAVFSVNQVRHLYVVDKVATVNEKATKGSIEVNSDKNKTHLYFKYMGAGGQIRSDLIAIENIISASATDANAMKAPLKKYKVVLDSNVNEGNPMVGQDYILRITFRNYIGLSEEDQYYKYGMVHAASNMTPATFYKILAQSLVQNFSREVSSLLKFYLETDGDDPAEEGTLIEVNTSTNFSSLDGEYTGLVIEEMPQEWELGLVPQTSLNFSIHPDRVVENGDEVVWGIVNKLTPTNFITNGHQIADLEYFCMGERGDMYRNVGYPYVLKTTYLVDPTKEYNTIDIHYSYIGSNESVQKSEKDITLVIPKVGNTDAVANKLTNDLISAINTATGLSIATLKV